MTKDIFISLITASNSRKNIVRQLTMRPDPTLDLESGSIISSSTAGNRSYNQKRLRAGRHRFGQRRIGRLMRQILRAREEAHERPALLRHMVANRTLQLRIT